MLSDHKHTIEDMRERHIARLKKLKDAIQNDIHDDDGKADSADDIAIGTEVSKTIVEAAREEEQEAREEQPEAREEQPEPGEEKQGAGEEAPEETGEGEEKQEAPEET